MAPPCKAFASGIIKEAWTSQCHSRSSCVASHLFRKPNELWTGMVLERAGGGRLLASRETSIPKQSYQAGISLQSKSAGMPGITRQRVGLPLKIFRLNSLLPPPQARLAPWRVGQGPAAPNQGLTRARCKRQQRGMCAGNLALRAINHPGCFAPIQLGTRIVVAAGHCLSSTLMAS